MRLGEFVCAFGIGDELVGELSTVVCLKGFNSEGCSFEQLFEEGLGVVD